MGNIFSYIPKFLGLILNFIYEHMSFGRYGLAIIIFTVFIKLVLLPLTVKQFKSNAQLQEIQPLIQELQRKYKNDNNKLNEEMMKVYAEHKYNPASGCLPLLVQLPILFSLIYVIGQPLTYMLNYSTADINNLLNAVPEAMKIKGFYAQIGAVNFHNILNMKFLGLDLGLVPTWRPNVLFGPEMGRYLPLILIPILSVITTFLSNKLMTAATMKKNNNSSGNDSAQDAAAAMTKNMTLIAPIMTLWVSFQFPAGLGLYWLVGNIFQIFQQLYLNKYVINKKEVKDK
ncbi:YidC/Oxa1 family membrane protein insertase [Acetivibrio cellulolyticus]|uniref:YidC/Oxa1 family membrane protein insertase n=1 Tax=Acetivibrio cellulolyticus TaxID=35830 RepID=UPI0001E2EBB2|nr:YidC/Oxa1 family membrane protein insertase [Acetivibrio cellulolyticus]